MEPEIWDREEIQKLIMYEPNKRNKAIIALSWDMDGRPHEITPLPKQPVISSSRNRRSSTDSAALLEAIEKVALEYPSYGVRRITAMLHRGGITANRKKVYRLLKLANLVRKRSVRKHVIIKRIFTVPERPDQLWQQDITYIWCGPYFLGQSLLQRVRLDRLRRK